MFCTSQNSKFQDLPKFQFSGGWVFCTSQNSKFQDLPKFQFSGGGGGCGSSVPVKSQSAKICLNFNFWERGVFCTSQKCQDLPKIQFSWGGGWGGLSGMGGCSVSVKTQSPKICLNFNFRGLGGGGLLYQIPEQGVLANLSANFALPLSGNLCITDSLSHVLDS